MVLDDDDILPLSAIAKHAKALMRSPGASFSYGRFARFKGQSPPSSSDILEEEVCTAPRSASARDKADGKLLFDQSHLERAQGSKLKAGLYDRRLQYSQDYEMVLR